MLQSPRPAHIIEPSQTIASLKTVHMLSTRMFLSIRLIFNLGATYTPRSSPVPGNSLALVGMDTVCMSVSDHSGMGEGEEDDK